MKNWHDRFPNKTPWTRAQVVRLRDLRGKGASLDEIAREVGHPPGACESKAHVMGYSKPRSTRCWIREDTKLLKRLHAQGMRPQQIARRLGRTTAEIDQKASLLGLNANTVRRWTADEDAFLKSLSAQKIGDEEIARRLGRSTAAVRGRLDALKRGDATFAKPKDMRRPCLCCKRLFNSQGLGNRLCKNCRTTSVSPFEI